MAFIKNSTCQLIQGEIPLHQKWMKFPCMVHTSAVKSNKTNTQTDNNERYHVESLDWDHIGYLFSIEQDGRIFYSEKTGDKQYHCRGQNDKSFPPKINSQFEIVFENIVIENPNKNTITIAETAVPIIAPLKPPCPSAITAAVPHSKKLVIINVIYKTSLKQK